MGIDNIKALKGEDDGIFPHKCVVVECERIVEFDDEPWCFTHSPDEGSSLAGYSARRGDRVVMKYKVELNE